MKKIILMMTLVLSIIGGCTVYYDDIGSIKIVQNPIKTQYFQGESLDLTGLKVAKVYEKNNIEEEVEIEDLKIVGFDSSIIGTQTIIIEYEENSKKEYASFEITIVKKLKKVSIATTPRTTFFKGENFNTTGLVVSATFEDGTTEVVNDYTISYPDMNTIGMKTVTIALNRNGILMQANYIIEVYQLLYIEIGNNPYILNYSEGDELDLTGLIVNAVGSGIKTQITDYKTTPQAGSKLTTETNKIVVSFLNETKEIPITVTAK